MWLSNPVLNLATYENRPNCLLRRSPKPRRLRKSRIVLATRYGVTWQPTNNAKSACFDVCQNLVASEITFPYTKTPLLVHETAKTILPCTEMALLVHGSRYGTKEGEGKAW